MWSLVVLSVALFTTRVSATSFTVQLTKQSTQRNTNSGIYRLSAASFQDLAGPTTLPITNFAYELYTAQIGIGSPPTYYNLVVDTGSSNTFCGAGIQYVKTNTSIPTGEAANMTYGTAKWSGLEFLDQVTITSGLVIKSQSIGNALNSTGFDNFDGIIGFGPRDITRGTFPSHPNETIPTVMNNLVSEGMIKKEILGVYFAPSTNDTQINGALNFGDVDSSLHVGELTYVPTTTTHPSSLYWGINITSLTYGDNMTVIPTSSAGIVDTGTTLIVLSDSYFDKYMNAIPGATFDHSLSTIVIPRESIPKMHCLDFFIAGRRFTLDVAAQLISTSENKKMGLDPEKQYGVVSKFGLHSGRGLDFILGQKFLERYYSVFDSEANRVGFAQTNNTFSTYQG